MLFWAIHKVDDGFEVREIEIWVDGIIQTKTHRELLFTSLEQARTHIPDGTRRRPPSPDTRDPTLLETWF